MRVDCILFSLLAFNSSYSIPSRAIFNNFSILQAYKLFDPAIHCPSDMLRFTGTNLGERGIDQFFRTHRCNAVCSKMGLKRHPLQPGRCL
jgi:hypothetical protein